MIFPKNEQFDLDATLVGLAVTEAADAMAETKDDADAAPEPPQVAAVPSPEGEAPREAEEVLLPHADWRPHLPDLPDLPEFQDPLAV